MTTLPDGSERTTLVEGCAHPDGIVADVAGGLLYWTNMGPDFDGANGSIERIRMDGSEQNGLDSIRFFTPHQDDNPTLAARVHHDV